jgi:hypothetical protein
MYFGRLPISKCSRLVADALNNSAMELRNDNETRMTQYVHTEPPEWQVLTWCCCRVTTAFQEQLSAFRGGEEKRLAQLVFPHLSKESSSV